MSGRVKATASRLGSDFRAADFERAREQLSLLAPLAILSLFTAFCLTLSYRLNIWQDEAYSLHTSGSGISRALEQGIAFEAQAPLYFVALAAWRALNASAFNARLFSIGCSVFALYAGWMFARRYLTAISSTVVLAVLAFNPFTVWAAVEIRPYSAVVMFSAVLLYAFFRGFIDEKSSAPARVAYVFLAVVGIYTQYYVALMLPAAGLALVVTRRWKVVPVYLAAMIPIAVALAPLAFILPEQFRAYHAFAVAFHLPAYAMVTALLEYALPHDWVASWAHSLVENAIYLAAAAVPIAIASRHLRRLSRTTEALLAINGMLFALFTAAITLGHIHVLIPRHTIVMLLPVMLLSLSLIGDLLPERRGLVLGAYVAVFAAFASLSLFHDYRSMAKLGDWSRVAAFVRANAAPSDLITIFNAEAELPFRYYFHGPNTIRAIPQSMSFERFDEDAFVLHDDKAVASSFKKTSPGYRRVWLVESSACSTQGDFFGCRYLEQYYRAYFRTIRVANFSGSTVRELEARSSVAARAVGGSN